MKKYRNTAFLLIIISLLSVWFCNKIIKWSASNHIYSDVSQIPYNKTAILLGTSPTLSSGYSNLFFEYRIDAAVALYNAGKVKYFIVSGDNHIETYDEPNEMKKALMAKGIPSDKIYLDYAGFRTYDSVIRGEEVFGQHSYTIISQAFHNERALFIARRKGIDAIAFNAKDVSAKFGIYTQLREIFARVKTILDIYLLPVHPKFLGAKIIIPE